MINEFYAKLSKNEKLLLLIASCCVILVLMDQLVLGPILSQIKLLDAEIKAKSQTIRRNLRILSFRDSIMSEFSKYSHYFDMGGKSEDEIISNLLKAIEGVAKDKEITISNVKPGDFENNPVFRVYKTSLECMGKLSDLLQFMSALEESDDLFQIERYALTPKSKGSDIMKCSIDVARIFMTLENSDQAEPAHQKKNSSKKETKNEQPKAPEPDGN